MSPAAGTVTDTDNRSLLLREEFEWALDCIQTRNCRVYMGESQDQDQDEVEGDSESEDGNENENENRISVLSPYFDLMNHDMSVRTIFEVKYPNQQGAPFTEPVLTVRYEDGGVKKGDQVYLNYRRY